MPWFAAARLCPSRKRGRQNPSANALRTDIGRKPPHPRSDSGTRLASAENRTRRVPGRAYVRSMFYHSPMLLATANGGTGRTGISLFSGFLGPDGLHQVIELPIFRS